MNYLKYTFLTIFTSILGHLKFFWFFISQSYYLVIREDSWIIPVLQNLWRHLLMSTWHILWKVLHAWKIVFFVMCKSLCKIRSELSAAAFRTSEMCLEVWMVTLHNALSPPGPCSAASLLFRFRNYVSQTHTFHQHNFPENIQFCFLQNFNIFLFMVVLLVFITLQYLSVVYFVVSYLSVSLLCSLYCYFTDVMKFLVRLDIIRDTCNPGTQEVKAGVL